MENNNKQRSGEFKDSVKIIGGALKSSLKNHKVLWGAGIAIVVLIILVSVFSSLINSQNFSARVMDVLMPTCLPTRGEDDPVQYDFYRELNPDYIKSDTKIEGDNYIEIFNYYYIDENGEKQYIENGVYNYTDENGKSQTSFVAVGFMYSMGEKVTHIKEVIKIIAWVLAAALVVLLIVIWYIKDKKRNEQNKPKRIRKAENKNQ